MRKLIYASAIFLCIIQLSTNLYSQEYRWQALPNAPTSPARFEDVYFINPLTGWVIQNVRSNNVQLPNLYKTTDGGESWQNLADTNFGYPRCIGFANSNTGWIGTYLSRRDTIGIYKTTNGGITWFPQFVGNRKDSVGVCGLYVLNDNYVFASGRWFEPAKFYKTSNGGDNWMVVDMSSYVTRLIDCYFISKDSGFVVGGVGNIDSSRAVILFTSNGGINWVNKITTNTKGQFGWKISFPSKDYGYVSLPRYSSTGGSYFLKTTDGGNTWEEKTVLPSVVLDQEGIGFINNSTGWIGGWTMGVYKTTNSGNTWEHETWGQNINRFRFFGDTLGYAVGLTVYKFEFDTTVGINQIASEIPEKFELSQNFPNPFNPVTTIRFTVLDYEDTKLTIFDALGREIEVLVNERLYPGIYEYSFDATGLHSGVYFYRIETFRYTETKKMILLK